MNWTENKTSECDKSRSERERYSQLKIKCPVQIIRVTTEWCPRQTNSWLPSTTLHRRTVWSADADMMEYSQKATQVTRPSWPVSSSSGSHGCVTRGDHTRTKPSWPPVASNVESSLTLKHWTPPSCASTTCSSRHSGACCDLDSTKPIDHPTYTTFDKMQL